MNNRFLASAASGAIMPGAFADDGIVATVRRSIIDMPTCSDGPSLEELAAFFKMIAKRPHSATVREWAQAMAERIADAND